MIINEFLPDRPPVLHELTFPNGLRSDELAVTLIDPSNNQLYVHPLEPHDFGFSNRLAADGFSQGQIIEEQGVPAFIRYPAHSDLISLPNVINASYQIEDGHHDILEVLRLTGRALQQIRQRYNVLPQLRSIDDIAVDRISGQPELIPPFQIKADSTVTGVLGYLYRDAIERCNSEEEKSVVAACFNRAMSEVEGL